MNTGNRRGEENAVNAEFQYKYDNEEVRQTVTAVQSVCDLLSSEGGSLGYESSLLRLEG